MNKTKIIGTGLNGLIGSRVGELLKDRYQFQSISRSTGVDITNKEQIYSVISSFDADIVLHLAAKTHVDECEKDTELDLEIISEKDPEKKRKRFEESQTAWAINAYGTQNIVEACKATKKKLIYFSTDFVFDGIDAPANGYSEEDKPNPINWYAITKFQGEELVRNAGIPYIIVRPAFPYGISSVDKKDFVGVILSHLQNGKTIAGVTDQIFMPTYIDDIVLALDTLIQSNTHGIYHVVGNQALSPYDAAMLIAQTFTIPPELIQKTTRDVYFKDRAKRPYNLTLKHDKIEKLGIKMRSFEQGLRQLKV